MKFLGYIFLFLSVQFCFGQKEVIDTTWVDSEWKEISKKYASFYRTIQKKENAYLVTDSYLNGNPQMIAEASQVIPNIIKNGNCIYYYKNNVKGSNGNYKNGNKIGTWIEYFNNGKDSSVINYLEDGTKNYISKSKYEDIFTIVEEMPEYPEGTTVMYNFIQSNILYPKEAEKKKWTGKTFIKFIVDTDGRLTDIAVAKSSGYTILDEEAIRVVTLMPKWKSGFQLGKPVKVKITIPFNFNLNN